MAAHCKKVRPCRVAVNCFILVVVVVFIKIVLVLPIVVFLRHDSDVTSSFPRGVMVITSVSQDQGQVQKTVLTWRPEAHRLMEIYKHLNIRKEEAEMFLPLTLKSEVLMGNQQMCEDGVSESQVDVLFIIHTSPTNIHRRMQMRSTIFHEAFFQPFKVRVAFLIGRVPDDRLQKSLEYEYAQYSDLVQGNFMDTYKNLSHKGVMGLRWMTEHCAGARHVVKLNDDVYFDTFKLLLRLRSLFDSTDRAIFCNVVLENTSTILRNDSRWGVDERQFQGLEVYPYDYCSGFAVIITADLVPHLYRAAFFTPAIWIDDLYMFGMLPRVVGNVTMLDIGYQEQYLDSRTEGVINCLRTRRNDCPTLATPCYDRDQWETLWNLTYHLNVDTDWKVPFLKVQ